MKKILIFIALITFPVITFGQNTPNDVPEQDRTITVENLSVSQPNEDQFALGTFSKSDVNNLSYKKSIELISIKAYRKSLQIKVKEIKSC